jgi:hypothetical protein
MFFAFQNQPDGGACPQVAVICIVSRMWRLSAVVIPVPCPRHLKKVLPRQKSQFGSTWHGGARHYGMSSRCASGEAPIEIISVICIPAVWGWKGYPNKHGNQGRAASNGFGARSTLRQHHPHAFDRCNSKGK